MRSGLKIVLFLAIYATGCCSLILGETGPDAYKAMNQNEKQFVDNVLLKIKAETTIEELIEALGPIRKQVFSKMYDWRLEDNGTRYGVRVYFSDNRIHTIKFIRVGKFIWQHHLK